MTNLGKLLAERNLTNRQLSELSGVPYTQVRYWRRPDAKHSYIDKAIKLADALEVSLEDLLRVDRQAVPVRRTQP